MKNRSPTVSVIIASHRPNMLTTLLKALDRQRTTVAFEVIIVTDYPAGTLQSTFSYFSWLYINDAGIGIKRNAGVKIAYGGIIAFTDDDCVPASDWIEQGWNYLSEHPGATAVEGQTTIEHSTTVPHAATREYRRLEKPGYRTNNLFFRKHQFERLGGFDERFTVQREDIDLAFSALEQGMQIDFSPLIRVTHRFRKGEKWDLLKNCRNRRFDPLLFSKHPRRYLTSAGSPLPPSQAAVFTAHLATLFILLKRPKAAPFISGVNLLLCSLLGLRRSGLSPFSPAQWLRETLQLFVAPLLVIAALMYGCTQLLSNKNR